MAKIMVEWVALEILETRVKDEIITQVTRTEAQAKQLEELMQAIVKQQEEIGANIREVKGVMELAQSKSDNMEKVVEEKFKEHDDRMDKARQMQTSLEDYISRTFGEARTYIDTPSAEF